MRISSRASSACVVTASPLTSVPFAALRFRKPVKYRLTRREDLRYSTKRGPWVFEYKDGIKKDGRIAVAGVAIYDLDFHLDPRRQFPLRPVRP